MGAENFEVAPSPEAIEELADLMAKEQRNKNRIEELVGEMKSLRSSFIGALIRYVDAIRLGRAPLDDDEKRQGLMSLFDDTEVAPTAGLEFTFRGLEDNEFKIMAKRAVLKSTDFTREEAEKIIESRQNQK